MSTEKNRQELINEIIDCTRVLPLEFQDALLTVAKGMALTKISIEQKPNIEQNKEFIDNGSNIIAFKKRG